MMEVLSREVADDGRQNWSSRVIFFMYFGLNVKLWGFWIDRYQSVIQFFRKLIFFFKPVHCVINQGTAL